MGVFTVSDAHAYVCSVLVLDASASQLVMVYWAFSAIGDIGLVV